MFPLQFPLHAKILLLLALGVLVSACSNPQMPLSPLITHKLTPQPDQERFTGVWYMPGQQNLWSRSHVKVYIAPVNTALVQKAYPQAAPHLAQQFHVALQKHIQHVIDDKNRASALRWQLVSSPAAATLTVNTAIVKLKATNAAGNIVADLLSVATPVPDTSLILGRFLDGDVGIEGNLTLTSASTPVVEFKAFNRDPLTLFSIKEFERFAFDEYNLNLFAKGIAKILLNGQKNPIPATGGIDLNPF